MDNLSEFKMKFRLSLVIGVALTFLLTVMLVFAIMSPDLPLRNRGNNFGSSGSDSFEGCPCRGGCANYNCQPGCSDSADACCGQNQGCAMPCNACRLSCNCPSQSCKSDSCNNCSCHLPENGCSSCKQMSYPNCSLLTQQSNLESGEPTTVIKEKVSDVLMTNCTCTCQVVTSNCTSCGNTTSLNECSCNCSQSITTPLGGYNVTTEEEDERLMKINGSVENVSKEWDEFDFSDEDDLELDFWNTSFLTLINQVLSKNEQNSVTISTTTTTTTATTTSTILPLVKVIPTRERRLRSKKKTKTGRKPWPKKLVRDPLI